jgi:vacuolar protein sorting-associated protein VTA1
VKAIKEGNDPNESNPKHEEPQQLELDPNDPAVQSLGNAPSDTIPRPVTVEEVPDADLRRDAAGVSLPHSPVSAGPSPVSEGELKLPGVPTDLSDPAPSGYFDSAPAFPPQSHHQRNSQTTPDLPAPPTGWTLSQPSPEASPLPTAWSQPPVSPPPGAGFYNQPTTPTTIPPTFATNLPPTAAVASPPISPPTNPYPVNMAPTAYTARPTAPPVAPAVNYASAQSGSSTVDEAAMVGAQKHARWAISALNFEDVPTAVRELRQALELLGAT